MSVQSEINRIKTNIAGAYSAVSEKGGTVPQTQNSSNLAEAIRSIPSGSSEIYSIDEVRIGTWIDGKPLYRKVIQVTTGANGVVVDYSFNVSMDQPVKLYGMLFQDSTYKIPMPSYWDSTIYVDCYFGENVIHVRAVGTVYAHKRAVLIAEYTKTTDQPTIQLDSQPLQSVADTKETAAMPVTADESKYE